MVCRRVKELASKILPGFFFRLSVCLTIAFHFVCIFSFFLTKHFWTRAGVFIISSRKRKGKEHKAKKNNEHEKETENGKRNRKKERIKKTEKGKETKRKRKGKETGKGKGRGERERGMGKEKGNGKRNRERKE